MKRKMIHFVAAAGVVASGLGVGSLIGAGSAAAGTVPGYQAAPARATFVEDACLADWWRPGIYKDINGVKHELRPFIGPIPPGECRPMVWVPV